MITAQDNVELENLTLISVSADPEVARALAVLKEKGITGAQVDRLQRIQPTKQQVRRAKRSLLDELVKNEVGRFLAKHGLNPVGRDLDRPTRENFKTVKSAIDLQIKTMVPSGATARKDYTSDDCDYLIAQLPHIVETAEEKLRDG